MKRILAYIFLAALLFLQTACVHENLSDSGISASGDGQPVTLNFDVLLPDSRTVATRSTVLDGVPENPDSDYLDELKIYLFVFENYENNGTPATNYMREVLCGDKIVPVQSGTKSDPEHQGRAFRQFSVTLENTSNNAIIHMVATSDPTMEAQIEQIKDRSELSIFYGTAGLYTQDPYEAYWKRIDLNMPINNANKDKLQRALSHIMLTRNFVGVTLNVDLSNAENSTETAKTFVLDGYILVNALDRGYVAAYNDSRDTFVDFQKGQDGGAVPYESLIDAGYMGVRHPLSERENKDEDASWTESYADTDDPKIWNTDMKYTFERPYQSQHRTYLLLKGRFGELGEPRYVKLDIGAIDGTELKVDGPFGVFDTYHLLRNIQYNVIIKEILTDKVGYKSIDEALSAPPANNVSTSVETGSLLNIYDGVDHMQVNVTKLIIVDDDNGDPYPSEADILWRYWLDYRNNGGSLKNSVVKWNQTGYDFRTMPDPSGIIASWSGRNRKTDVTDEAPKHITEYPDGVYRDENYDDCARIDDTGGEWWGFHLKFNRPTDIPKQKTIRLYNPFGLSRDVTLIMRRRWQFVNNTPETEHNVEVYPGYYSFEDNTMPEGIETMQQMREWYRQNYNDVEGKVGPHRGAHLTVMFELPEDLPEAIFPLDIKIEADRQNIENAYVGNAIVTTAPSLFEDVASLRLQFVKTVTWEYYHGSGDASSKPHRIVTARFRTTTDVQMVGEVGDQAITNVRVGNPYFISGSDTFTRASFDDVYDPTRTRWYWNFGDSEWRIYNNASLNTDLQAAVTGESGNLNELYFSNYTYFHQGGGYYMAITTANGNDIGNPALSFGVKIAADKFKGTLTVKATPNKPFYRSTLAGNNWNNADKFNREIYFGVVFDDNSKNVSRQVFTCEQENGGVTDRSGTLPLRTFSFDLSMIDNSLNKEIREIRIWSKNVAGHTDDATRFFSIEMNLTE